MIRDDLQERLKRLDEDASLLFDNDRRFRLVVVGGSALILLEVINRATHDIDAVAASGEIRSLLAKYDINLQVQAYINNFPYNYEDRLVPLPIQGKRIDFYTASLEDIVIAELFSVRETDQRDIENPSVRNALDWNKLDHIANDRDEVQLNALNERCYFDFKTNYDKYVERFRPCGH